MKKKQSMNADDVLDQIKAAFLKEGPIEGSWINFEKQPLRKFAVTSQGYTGGITRTEDGQLITYEFLADAKQELFWIFNDRSLINTHCYTTDAQ